MVACLLQAVVKLQFWPGFEPGYPMRYKKKKLLPQGDLIRGPFACKRDVMALRYSDNMILLVDLRNQILIESEMIFHFEKAILFIRFRVFVIFSKIPRGI